MSQENVESLRAFWEAWHPPEVPDMSQLDPEVTYEDDNLPDHAGEVYRGREGVARAAQRWIEPFETFSIELEQIIGEGDLLVSVHTFRGTARHTGIEIAAPVAYTWAFRDGKIIHFRSYASLDDALEAAGRRE